MNLRGAAVIFCGVVHRCAVLPIRDIPMDITGNHQDCLLLEIRTTLAAVSRGDL